MKTLFLLAMPLFASRIDDCFAMRGNHSEDAIKAMSRALDDAELRSCAAENLRSAAAVDALRSALASPIPETRAIAARTLGTFKREDLIQAIAAEASDENLLVASNAMAGLANYGGPVVVPALEQLARKGGMIGDLALQRLLVLAPANALTSARALLKTGSVADRLYGLRVIADLGNSSDLPALQKIAAETEDRLESRSRGFGFMPAISLSRAAQTAAAAIESREKDATVRSSNGPAHPNDH